MSRSSGKRVENEILTKRSDNIDVSKVDVLNEMVDQFGTGRYISRRRIPDQAPPTGAGVSFRNPAPFAGRVGVQNYDWLVDPAGTVLESLELTAYCETDGATEVIGDTIDLFPPIQQVVVYFDSAEACRVEAKELAIMTYSMASDNGKKRMNKQGLFTRVTAVAGATALDLNYQEMSIPWWKYLGYSEDADSSKTSCVIKGVSRIRFSITWASTPFVTSRAATTFLCNELQLRLVERQYPEATLAEIVKPLSAGNNMISTYHTFPEFREDFTSTAGGTYGQVRVDLGSIRGERILGMFIYIVPTATVDDPFTCVDWKTNDSGDSIRIQFNSTMVWSEDRIADIRSKVADTVQRLCPTLTPPVYPAGFTRVALAGAATVNEEAPLWISLSTGSIFELQDQTGMVFPTEQRVDLLFQQLEGLGAATAYTMRIFAVGMRAWAF